MQFDDFTDRVVVITGGANGIGRSAALAFAREGANVVLADRDGKGLVATVNAVQELGRRALAVPCDVTSDEDLANLAARTLDRMGRADLIMANAGVAVGGRMDYIPISEWTRILDVNVVGVARTVRAFIPHFLEQEEGWVVITSGRDGLFAADPFNAPFAAASHALVGMAKSLYQYLQPEGVGVTLLCPRLTDTGFPKGSVAWGPTGPRMGTDQDLSGADSPDAVAELLLDGLAEGRFLVSSTPDTPKRMARFAADPDRYLSALIGETQPAAAPTAS